MNQVLIGIDGDALSDKRMVMILKIAAVTNTGMYRKRNEDSFLVYPNVVAMESMNEPMYWQIDTVPVLLAVADGVGGSVAGDVASREVLAVLAELPCPDGEEALIERIHRAQIHLDQLVLQNMQLEGLGTTLAGVLFIRGMLIVFSCGDSRVYIHNPCDTMGSGGMLRCLTRDHSMVQELIEEGQLTEKEARSHPLGHIITSCLSGGRQRHSFDIRVSHHPLYDGMRVVICTDGVWDYGGEEFVAAACFGDPVIATRRVLRVCYDAGAPDNITLIIADLHVDG